MNAPYTLPAALPIAHATHRPRPHAYDVARHGDDELWVRVSGPKRSHERPVLSPLTAVGASTPEAPGRDDASSGVPPGVVAATPGTEEAP